MTDDQASAIFSSFQTDSITGKRICQTSADFVRSKKGILDTCVAHSCTRSAYRRCSFSVSYQIWRVMPKRKEKNEIVERRKRKCRLYDFRLVIKWPHFDTNSIVSSFINRVCDIFLCTVHIAYICLASMTMCSRHAKHNQWVQNCMNLLRRMNHVENILSFSHRKIAFFLYFLRHSNIVASASFQGTQWLEMSPTAHQVWEYSLCLEYI